MGVVCPAAPMTSLFSTSAWPNSPFPSPVLPLSSLLTLQAFKYLLENRSTRRADLHTVVTLLAHVCFHLTITVNLIPSSANRPLTFLLLSSLQMLVETDCGLNAYKDVVQGLEKDKVRSCAEMT